MTATAAPFGLRPSMHGSGGVVRPIRRSIDPANTTPIYKGSPIQINAADGFISLSGAGTPSGATNQVDGVFIGCEYNDATGKYNVSPFWPGTTGCTNIVAWVVEDTNAIFEVQSSGSIPRSAVGNGLNLSPSPGSGSLMTGLSTATVTATPVAAALAQFVVVDAAVSEDNAFGDAFTIVRVKLAASKFATSITVQ